MWACSIHAVFLRGFGLAGHRVVVRSDFVFRCDGVGLLDAVGVIFVCHAPCEGTYVFLCDRRWRWRAWRGRAACVGFGARERGRGPPLRRRGVLVPVSGWARRRGLLGLLLRVRGARGRGVGFMRWRSLHRCVEPRHHRRDRCCEVTRSEEVEDRDQDHCRCVHVSRRRSQSFVDEFSQLVPFRVDVLCGVGCVVHVGRQMDAGNRGSSRVGMLVVGRWWAEQGGEDSFWPVGRAWEGP